MSYIPSHTPLLSDAQRLQDGGIRHGKRCSQGKPHRGLPKFRILANFYVNSRNFISITLLILFLPCLARFGQVPLISHDFFLLDNFLLIFYHIGRGVSRTRNHKSPLEASANRHRSASTPGMMNSIICSPRFHTYTTGSHTHNHLWLLSACKFCRYILQDHIRAPESWRCSQRHICGCRPDRVLFPPRRRFAESAASSQPVPRQSGSAMQTCRFISSVNSTFMGSVPPLSGR